MSSTNDFEIENGILKKYTGPGGDVEIPDGVTAIGDRAFSGWRLTSIVIPDSVTAIGKSAFWCCSLTSIVIPNSVTAIGDYAFSYCSSLTSIVIPDSVTAIGKEAFYECSSLTSIVIPDSVTAIGGSAFYDCSSLTSIVIPDSVTAISDRAFHGCSSLTSIVIPDSVTAIGGWAFEYCRSLTSIVIPDSVTAIGNVAFSGCSSLTSIVIPNSVTAIGYRAFSGCSSLMSIVIPDSVTAIGDWAFSGCISLMSIVIPDSVTAIGDRAFEECSSLTSVTIPKSVTSIGEEAFAHCKKLSRFSPLRSDCKLEKNPFGDTLPEGMVSCVENLYPLFTDGTLKQCVLNGSVFPKLASGLQTEIFMTRQGKALAPAYEKCVQDPDALGRNILERLSGKSSAKECNTVAAFLTIFSQKASEEILRQLYEALKQLKTAAKALKTIEADTSLIMKLNSEAKTSLSESEKTVMEILQQEHKSMMSLTNAVKQFYGLEVAALPKVTCTDGAQAPEPAMAYLLTAHEELQEQRDVAAAYPSSGVCEHAAEILALLDQKCFQSALRTLADANLGLSGRSKKMFLAYPICRYANETLMAELTRRAPKWASSVSGNDAPPLRTFHMAALYSETRAAMFFADKFGDLDKYAGIRGTDADTIRDKYLSDVGLDEKGGKVYDLGNQTVTARLQKDLSFLVELPTGKTAKSLPKKGADAEKYAAANADFSEMKKNAKKIVKNRVSILFEDFLSGRARKADAWKESYLKNPLLRQVASLLVWVQDGKTFLLTDTGAVTADGTPYSIGDAEIVLAHPMEMSQNDLIAWQKYFAANGIKQPFEQIWEPVVDENSVKEDRYQGCMIPYYRFLGQNKHGIHVKDEDFHNEIDISFDDCNADIYLIDWLQHEISPDSPFEIRNFRVERFTRKANHIIAYLDRVTIYDRIRKDDTGISAFLPQFTLAQITDFVARVTEKGDCPNSTAALLEYKQAKYPDTDPFADFVLEW